MLTTTGSKHTYRCDRCKHQTEVEDDAREDRRGTAADPLAQRRHDAPAGWVIASLSFVDGREIIYGPHAGRALWCRDCGHDAELFARGRQLSDVY